MLHLLWPTFLKPYQWRPSSSFIGYLEYPIAYFHLWILPRLRVLLLVCRFRLLEGNSPQYLQVRILITTRLMFSLLRSKRNFLLFRMLEPPTILQIIQYWFVHPRFQLHKHCNHTMAIVVFLLKTKHKTKFSDLLLLRRSNFMAMMVAMRFWGKLSRNNNFLHSSSQWKIILSWPFQLRLWNCRNLSRVRPLNSRSRKKKNQSNKLEIKRKIWGLRGFRTWMIPSTS